MSFRLIPVLLTAGLVLAAGPVAARAQDDVAVYKKVTPRQMQRVLRDLGFEYEKLSEDGDKVQRWRFMMDGYKVLLLSDGTDLQLYAGFDTKVSLSRINEWNRSKRWGRAYVAKDNKGVAMETDLDFTGGVSLNCIKEFVKLYRVLLKSFVKFINDE